MAQYSIFSLFKNALSRHGNWDRAWRDAMPKPAYDVVIIGAGGNTGRNTTIIRSNYLWDESAALYEKFRPRPSAASAPPSLPKSAI